MRVIRRGLQGSGQPGLVDAAVSFAASVIGSHPAASDVLFAAVHLGPGAGLLWPRVSRIALPAESLHVWMG